MDGESTICRVPAPSAPLLIVNPFAGEGRALRLQPWLQQRLKLASPGARMLKTQAPGHARELALYAAAFIAYTWHFARRNPAVGQSATTER